MMKGESAHPAEQEPQEEAEPNPNLGQRLACWIQEGEPKEEESFV